MLLGIVSDIHDNVPALRAALDGLRDAEALLVAGDLCSPFVLRILAAGFASGPVHVVAGNNDGDWLHLAQVARGFDHVTLHGPAFDGEVGGRRVFLNHYPEVAAAVDADRYDLIVYGHDHTFRAARGDDGAWRLNPGTLLGYAPRDDAYLDPSFLLFDTETDAPRPFRLRAGGADYRVEAGAPAPASAPAPAGGGGPNR